MRDIWEPLPRHWGILKGAEQGDPVQDGAFMVNGAANVHLLALDLISAELIHRPDENLPQYRLTTLGEEALRRHKGGERVAVQYGRELRIVSEAEVGDR